MDNYEIQNPQQTGYVYQDTALQASLIQRVFLWMTIGLAITGLTSYITYSSNLLYALFEMGRLAFFGLLAAQIGIVWYLSSRIHSMSFSTATILFGVYSLLTGVSISYIFAAFTMQSLATTFFVTAGTFGATALYGYVTKRDLSKMGSILMMGLIGLIIASLVNMFLKSATMDYIVSGIGVIIFTGLTAWDMQKLKLMFAEAYEDSEEVKKVSVLGALTLYLDFINLFLFLLRFLGRSRD